jgi:hypothetical protein
MAVRVFARLRERDRRERFVLGVWRQHALHRWLTFHDRRGTYGSSLAMAYVAYSASIAASTALNWWLTEMLGMHHLVAWLVALTSSVAMNYSLLERYAFPEVTVDGTEVAHGAGRTGSPSDLS